MSTPTNNTIKTTIEEKNIETVTKTLQNISQPTQEKAGQATEKASSLSQSPSADTVRPYSSNQRVEFEVDCIARWRIGKLIFGLKHVHRRIGGNVYLHWREDFKSPESTQEAAPGFVVIASTDPETIKFALDEVADLVQRVQNLRLHAPPQRYRLTITGGYEQV